MRNIDINRIFKKWSIGKTIILIASVVLIYLLISIYFANHFFFGTNINGADLSLKSYDDADNIIRDFVNAYSLQLVERNGEIEEIAGYDIGMEYNDKNSISDVYKDQNSFFWIISLIKSPKYYVNDLFICDREALENRINQLSCLNRDVIEPRNPEFRYINGSYVVIKEVYGNKIIKDRLKEAIESSILRGETKLDLNEMHCYENPRYNLNSSETLRTKKLLDKYVSTKISYIFDNEIVVLDGNAINKWLSVDENLEPVIDKRLVYEYILKLSKIYDTVGIAREFKTSTGKIIEVKGGLYGWKIDRAAETEALIENIKHGKVLEREPIYSQRALSRGKNEIGNTYVEINITRQHLWFYKNGKLITHGPVVTGNPNRGHSTVVGIYMLNYKQKGATLVGENYEADVTYWMPFFGNIGIHDAKWRYSFGGEIYKRRGSHGCVNAPVYLAKRIFENIEEGTPIICYEE